jgi:hypothetical protein
LKNPSHFYEITIISFNQLINNIKNISNEFQDFQGRKSSIEILIYLIMIVIGYDNDPLKCHKDNKAKLEIDDEWENFLIESLSQIEVMIFFNQLIIIIINFPKIIKNYLIF